MPDALPDPRVTATLDRLHEAAKGDRWVCLRAAPAVLWSLVRGGSMLDGMLPYLKDAYIPVTPEQGKVLYLTARMIDARTIVEFGTSFGISALYLGAAAHANGGRFIGSEREPHKIAAARANLARGRARRRRGGAGRRRDGDVPGSPGADRLRAARRLEGHLPADAAAPAPEAPEGRRRLRGQHLHLPERARAVRRLRPRPANGFESTTIPIGHGLEYSVVVA